MGSDNANFEAITYEGYGPSGVAVIVETTTDNRNRTVGNVRSYFSKYHGNLGNSGCVSFMFDDKGIIWPLFYTGVFFLLFNGILTLLFGYIEKKLNYFRS